jgi:hypothetical protein
MPGLNVVQTVGDFTLTLIHPLIGAGAAITLQGFLMDQEFLTTQQILDNVKRKVLVGGGTVALTNNVKAGELTLNCVQVSSTGNPLDGDVPLIASILQDLADSQGGLLRAVFGFNGGNQAINFLSVLLKSSPPLKLAGNDVPVYPTVFSYGSYVRG